jgi:hypothetical protein
MEKRGENSKTVGSVVVDASYAYHPLAFQRAAQLLHLSTKIIALTSFQELKVILFNKNSWSQGRLHPVKPHLGLKVRAGLCHILFNNTNTSLCCITFQ